jgi:uncharacterized protein (DUF1697 family)
MNSWVSILRGINVSGHNMIKMADLKQLYIKLGFANPSTYLQSGNVIFKDKGSLTEDQLVKKITSAILKDLGIKVPVILRSSYEMQKIHSSNPFTVEKDIDPEKLHVTFLSELPEHDKVEKLKQRDFSPERFVITGREIYLYCPDGYGRAKLNNNFLEKALSVPGTTRNWKTVSALSTSN